MTASRDTSETDQVPTDLGAAAADRAGAELRRVLLHHLALDVRPNRLAEIVVALCAAIEPLVVSPTVGERGVLSDREVQVLVGMATGSSNAQIGRRLHLSEDTVKTYARRLFRSLGVRDRAHAVAQGFQQGILLIGGAGDRDGFRGVRPSAPARSRRSRRCGRTHPARVVDDALPPSRRSVEGAPVDELIGGAPARTAGPRRGRRTPGTR